LGIFLLDNYFVLSILTFDTGEIKSDIDISKHTCSEYFACSLRQKLEDSFENCYAIKGIVS
jgi:hypothetical protein